MLAGVGQGVPLKFRPDKVASRVIFDRSIDNSPFKALIPYLVTTRYVFLINAAARVPAPKGALPKPATHCVILAAALLD
jgi:hypothetical protein